MDYHGSHRSFRSVAWLATLDLIPGSGSPDAAGGALMDGSNPAWSVRAKRVCHSAAKENRKGSEYRHWE